MKKALVITLLLGGSYAVAADLENGKAIAMQDCASCHGATGNMPQQPNYPILAGQHADYLEHALKGYVDGSRSGPQAGPMIGFASSLSDQDREDVAAWFAAQESALGEATIRRTDPIITD
ncbi:cytochrome c [Gammaproteobacteria bacterium]|nr:cytochrome c [Gammaproteobacteria bacterium]